VVDYGSCNITTYIGQKEKIKEKREKKEKKI